MYIILFSALTDGTVSIMHPKTGDAPNNAQNTRLSLSRLLSPALMAEEQQQKAQGIPPRYDLNAKWDACLDITMRRLTYSSLAGAFTALLFFSEFSPPRSISVFLPSVWSPVRQLSPRSIVLWAGCTRLGDRLWEIPQIAFVSSSIKLLCFSFHSWILLSF